MCGTSTSYDDNYCRRCGTVLRNMQLPVKRPQPPLPALWRQAAPVAARGAALVLAGIAGEWLLRSAARRTLGSGRRPARNTAIAARKGTSAGAAALSELIVIRRLIVRR